MIKQNILVANREGKNLFGRAAFSVRVSIKWYRKERARDDVHCNFGLECRAVSKFCGARTEYFFQLRVVKTIAS